MIQLSLLDDFKVDDMRKAVMKEFPRIEGEDCDEWWEFIRVEVDYRLSQNKKIPNYEDFKGLK